MEQSRKGTKKDEEEGTFWKKGPTDNYKLSLYLPEKQASQSPVLVSRSKNLSSSSKRLSQVIAKNRTQSRTNQDSVGFIVVRENIVFFRNLSGLVIVVIWIVHLILPYLSLLRKFPPQFRTHSQIQYCKPEKENFTLNDRTRILLEESGFRHCFNQFFLPTMEMWRQLQKKV